MELGVGIRRTFQEEETDRQVHCVWGGVGTQTEQAKPLEEWHPIARIPGSGLGLGGPHKEAFSRSSTHTA